MDLKTIRAKKRITQMQLGNQAGIHYSKISHFERGYLQPSEGEKCRLAQALKVNVADIQWS